MRDALVTVAAAAALCFGAACSSGADDTNGSDNLDEGDSGAGGHSGGHPSGDGGAGNPGGASSGGAPSGGGQPGTGGRSADTLVGTFSVQIVPAATGTGGTTKVIGKVSDGPTPEPIVWSSSAEAGDCKLMRPRVPFCETSCGADVCVEDDTCQGYPTALSVGTATLSGLATADGAPSFSMTPVAGNYQPVGVTFDYPPVTEGGAVKLDASGADVPAFSLETEGLAPFALTNSALVLTAGQPLSLTWAAGKTDAHVKVKLDISHHGGTKGKIECDAPDTGSLDIDGELVSKLLALGVAGFPTIVVTRESSASTSTSVGRIQLVVTSGVEVSVTVPGVESCSADTDCTGGKKCQANLTCG